MTLKGQTSGKKKVVAFTLLSSTSSDENQDWLLSLIPTWSKEVESMQHKVCFLKNVPPTFYDLLSF